MRPPWIRGSAPEPIAPSQMLVAFGGGEVERRSILLRRGEAERAMRSGGVVVGRESAERAFELAAARDQQPIEALGTDGTDEALGDGVRLRRTERRPRATPHTRLVRPRDDLQRRLAGQADLVGVSMTAGTVGHVRVR